MKVSRLDVSGHDTEPGTIRSDVPKGVVGGGPRHLKEVGWIAAPPMAIVVLGAVVCILEGQYGIYVGGLAAVYALAALGENMLLSHGGLPSIAPAAFLAVGAYATGIIANAGFPAPLAIIVGSLVAMVSGGIVALPALRLSGHYLALVTLALTLAVGDLINFFQSVTGGSSGLAVTKDVLSPTTVFVTSLVIVCGACILQDLAVRAGLGRLAHLVRDSEVASGSVGISTVRMKIILFAYSGLVTGLAGALLVSVADYISPGSFDLYFSIYILAAVVLGGMNRAVGAMLGGVFIVVIGQVAASSGYETIGIGLALIIGIVLRARRGLARGGVHRLRAQFAKVLRC